MTVRELLESGIDIQTEYQIRRYDEDKNEVAVIWVDGVPQYLHSDTEGLYWSCATEIIGYGDDWYALSVEMADLPDDDYEVSILIWLNGTIIGKYHGIDIVNFTVL